MNDLITAAFQTLATFFLGLSILALKRDRELKGISLWTILFFTIWTGWGAYNWYTLGLFWSLVSNVVMLMAYAVWLTLAFMSRTKPGLPK